MDQRFEVVIVIGRPAAGKSETIDFLRKTDARTRAMRFHIGACEEIDDFPFVWETFEIDDLLERLGQPRVFTTKNYFFKGEHLWNLFIGRINLEFRKKLARDPDFTKRQTVLIEFSRGGEHGFAEAFAQLADEILQRAAIVYINVSYEESARKNRRRFDAAQADSILFHSLPDEKMEFYYKTNDWERLSAGKKTGRIRIRDFDVPFVVFDNEPEVTDDPAKLGPALEQVFVVLWDLMHPSPK